MGGLAPPDLHQVPLKKLAQAGATTTKPRLCHVPNMEEAKMEKIKKRNWTMLLYPEDDSHKAAMEKLSSGGYKYVAILHDKDVVSEGDTNTPELVGTLKKEHWHVVLKFPQARYRTAVAKELGIAENYMEACANFDAACLYLVHANAEEKHQYDPTALFGTMVSSVTKLLHDDDEGTRILEIVKCIDAKPGRASYRDTLVWACKNGLYGEFRRLGSGVKWLIDEHNDELESEFVKQYGERYPKERFERFAEMTGDKDIQPL